MLHIFSTSRNLRAPVSALGKADRRRERGEGRRLGIRVRRTAVSGSVKVITLSPCSLPLRLLPFSFSPSSLHPFTPRLRIQSAWHHHIAFLVLLPRLGGAHQQARTLRAVPPPQKKQRGAEISMYECSLLSPLLT